MDNRTKKIPFSTSLATLECGHDVTYRCSPPAKYDYVLCRRCDDYRHVIQVTRKGVVKI